MIHRTSKLSKKNRNYPNTLRQNIWQDSYCTNWRMLLPPTKDKTWAPAASNWKNGGGGSHSLGVVSPWAAPVRSSVFRCMCMSFAFPVSTYPYLHIYLCPTDLHWCVWRKSPGGRPSAHPEYCSLVWWLGSFLLSPVHSLVFSWFLMHCCSSGGLSTVLFRISVVL